MIRLEEWVDIKALHRQGLSIRAIAKKLRISRNTVRKALKSDGPPAYHRPTKPSKLDPYKEYLIDRLSEFPELSCVRLLEELQKQGYDGSLTILRDFTRPYRIRRREPVVRFETLPGQQAQVDWSELGLHTIGEQDTKLYLFAMILGYSRALYSEVTTRTDTNTLLECHRRAFSYFGGVTREILYDNMKTVVIKREKGGDHRFNPAFMDFAGTIGFSPKLCRPYRAQTKGKVERVIGFVKDSFLLGRTFADLSDLNRQMIIWLDTKANTRTHATTRDVPFIRLAQEGLATVPNRLLDPEENPAPTPNPKRSSFRFEAPSVEKRPLSVYEEVAR